MARESSHGNTRNRSLDVAHGTLQSELDEPADIADEFVVLHSELRQLRLSYDRAEITANAYATALHENLLRGSDGSIWSVGADSERWFKKTRRNNVWVPAIPPPSDAGIMFTRVGSISTSSDAAPSTVDAAPVTGSTSTTVAHTETDEDGDELFDAVRSPDHIDVESGETEPDVPAIDVSDDRTNMPIPDTSKLN